MNDQAVEESKKSVAAKVLIESAKGNILLTQPTYVDKWYMPGGGVEKNEEPKEAAVREVYEELGINILQDDLQIIDTVFEKVDDVLTIVYRYKNKISEDTIFKLPPVEIRDYAFVSKTEVKNRLPSRYASFCENHLSQE